MLIPAEQMQTATWEPDVLLSFNIDCFHDFMIAKFLGEAKLKLKLQRMLWKVMFNLFVRSVDPSHLHKGGTRYMSTKELLLDLQQEEGNVTCSKVLVAVDL